MPFNLATVLMSLSPRPDKFTKITSSGRMAGAFSMAQAKAWLLSKAGRWRLTRRINALENTMRAAAAPLLATSTQLEEEEARLANDERSS